MINFADFNITKKNCLCLPFSDFERLVRKVAPTVKIEVDLDGLSYWDEENEEGCYEINDLLSSELGIEITSIHMDDCDYDVGVWIVYNEV